MYLVIDFQIQWSISKLLILHVRLPIYCKLFLIMTIAVNNINYYNYCFNILLAATSHRKMPLFMISYEDIIFLETHPRNESYSGFKQTRKKKHTLYQKRYTHESVILFIVHYFAERIPETSPMVCR